MFSSAEDVVGVEVSSGPPQHPQSSKRLRLDLRLGLGLVTWQLRSAAPRPRAAPAQGLRRWVSSWFTTRTGNATLGV